MNVLIAQCGGPTAVINASLAAFIAAGQADPRVNTIWGARLGLEGVFLGDWVDLTDLPPARLAALSQQPGAALGAGRYRADPEAHAALPKTLTAHGVDGLALIGGNGSMAAAHAVAAAAQAQRTSLRVVGVPKTIDNDLAGTDVAPGYGSAARFIAESTRAVGLDLGSMRHFDDVVVIEVMGRHAGWLAAAAALARTGADDAPHIVLLPEASVNEGRLLQRIGAVHARCGVCLIVAAEGAVDEEGRYLAEKRSAAQRDASGQRLLSLAAGVAPYLAHRVDRELSLRCRQIRPDLIQRSAHFAVLETDRMLARLVGQAAVTALTDGVSDCMIGLSQDAAWQARPVSLTSVIGRTRTVPASFYDAERFAITPQGLAQLRRLTGLDIGKEAAVVW